ncbi:hypothetical protein BvCmsKKNP002_00810 [Escherichia coli]|nr:hypothetical protein BvCmsKKNP002_00810 [Escherichia coli]
MQSTAPCQLDQRRQRRRNGEIPWRAPGTYTGREVQDIPGVLAVFAERRKDSFGPYVRLMSVTLN